MSYTKPINETNKISPITMEQKLDITPQKIRSVKKVDPQPELQKETLNLSRDSLQTAVNETNKMIFKDKDHFEFKVHERTGRIMVKLVDNETDEVIKEIPPEKILDLVASIWDLVGILVDERG